MLLVSLWTLTGLAPAWAITFSSNTTINADNTSYLNQNFIINNGIVVRFVGSGGNGGNVTITLPNGGTFSIGTGAQLIMAGTGNGNGGTLNVSMLGATANITLNGLIDARGAGSGRGGTIRIAGSNFSLGSGGDISAQATGTGQGGIIDLTETAGGGLLNIPSGFVMNTSGTATATQNLITIQADSVTIDGQLVANGLVSNSTGGKITLTARNGQLKIPTNGDINARGVGSGTGGTVEILAHRAGQSMDIDDCGNNSCSAGSDSELMLIHRNSRINTGGGGGTANGVIKIGRAGAGDINQDMSKFRDNQITGAGEFIWGDDGGNTANITISNFDKDSDFGGGNPIITMHGTTSITGTNNNDWDRVQAISSSGGTINLTDDSNSINVATLTTTGNATVTNTANGQITLSNATVGGNTTLQTDGNIVATSNNTLSGPIFINGESGAADRAGTVTLTNNTNTDIDRLRASNATVTVASAASNMTVDNLDVTTSTNLTATQDLTANAVTNNFGTTTAANGRNVSLRDNAGTFVLNGVATTGTLDVGSASGISITLANVDAAGAANIIAGGGNADITGNTNLVFRNAANFDTQDNAFGDINLTADFQGNTTFAGDLIQATDNAGAFTVTGITTGVNTTASTLSATGVGGDLTLSGITLDSSGATAQGRLDISANDQITIDGTGWSAANDIVNAWSTNGGNIAVSNVTLTGTAPLSGTATSVNPNQTTAGMHLATNGGSYTITNTSVNNNVNITANNDSIILGTNAAPVTITGTTTFNAGTGEVTGAGRYTGAVSGTAGRIGFEATSGNFTSGGLTATSGTGWYATDMGMIIATRNGDILGTGYTASGASNMMLMAGYDAYQNASNNIAVNNLSAAQNVYLYATGDSSGAGTGTAISVGGTSNINGHVTATNINASNNRSALRGGVNLSMTSGNLTSALIWSDSGTINLTNTGGSIMQNTAVYSPIYTSMNGRTIWAKGSVNMLAQGTATSHINVQLNALGAGSNVTARASGSNGGISVQLFGRIDGNLTVTNPGGGNVSGAVNLGTGLGASDSNLTDTNTVLDVYGSSLVRANGDVGMYGSFWGPVTVFGRRHTARVDKGSLNINQISTTLNSGTTINLTALKGSITGSNISNVAGSNVFLQAGSVVTRDKLSHIDLTGVNFQGNVSAVVAGSDNGASSGNSIRVTGTITGSKNASKPGGGSPNGQVNW